MSDSYVSSGKTSSGIVLNDPMYVDGTGHATDGNSGSELSVFNGAIIRDYAVSEPCLPGPAFSESVAANSGGSQYISSGSSQIIDTIFENNSAYRSGGAIYNYSGTVSLLNDGFRNNIAGQFGGAVYNYAGTILASGGFFTSNRTEHTGGAVYNMGSYSQSGGSFTGNSAPLAGGAMYNAGTMSLEGVLFTSNATSEYGGGAIYAKEGSLFVKDCDFISNTAETGEGAAIYGSSQSYVSIDGGTFSHNSTYGNGAAVQLTGSGQVRNAVFENNYTKRCGTLFINNEVTVDNVILRNNSAFWEEDDGTDDNPNIAAGTGIYVLDRGILTATNITVTGNYGEWGGAGMLQWFGSSYITSAVFKNNVAGNKKGYGATHTKGGGGGIHASSGVLRISSADFIANSAYDIGGGVYTCETETLLKDIRFTSNTAAAGGGGFCAWGGNIIISSADFEGNTTAEGAGGAICMTNRNGGSLTILDATFTNNRTLAKQRHGGALRTNIDVTASGVRFTGNSGHLGGAIFQNAGSMTLQNAAFTSNTATEFGGALVFSGMNGTIDNAIFSGNSTSVWGGAVYLTSGSTFIRSATFTGNNTVLSGGALFNAVSAVAELDSCTFSGNTVEQNGGALFNGAVMTITHGAFIKNVASKNYGAAIYNSATGTLAISDTVFSGNSALTANRTSGAAIYNNGGIVSLKDCSFATSTDSIFNTEGTVTLAGANTLAAELRSVNSGVLNIDISEKSASESAVVSNWSFVNLNGGGILWLTVSSSMADGTYKLAENASSFSGSFTVKDVTGAGYGSLSVGSSVSVGDITCSLAKAGGTLSVKISGGTPAPPVVPEGAVTTYKVISSSISSSLVSAANVMTGKSLLEAGAEGIMEVGSGGIASNTTVRTGGKIFVENGGTASKTTVNSKGNMYVSGGGTADSTTVNSKGRLVVLSGGTATNVTAKSGGHLQLHVAPDTYAQGTSKGSAFEMKDALLSNFIVDSGEALNVESGGTVNSTTVNSKGELWILSGGRVTGTLTMMNGAEVHFEQNSLMEFDISELDTTAPARVNNLSLIQGAPDYTITVSTTQAEGTYKLAEGAASFTGSMEVCTDSACFGSVTVGSTVEFAGQSYTLNLTDDLLSLTVSSAGPGPVVSGVSDDLNGDGRADIVMTIDQPTHPADGSTGAWLIQDDQTAAWGDLSQREAGWEIFGMGRTSEGKTTNDVYVKNTDNVIGAWTTDESGSINGWATIGEFDSSTQVLGLGDFNGNGQTDLLLRNTNGAVGCFFTNGQGWNYFQSLGDEWKLCAVGDLNGDGRDDVVLKHDAGFAGSWLTQADGTMAWADLDTLPDGFAIIGAGDFNGDGTDDVLLKNGNYYGAWLVNNGNAAGWMGLGDLGDVTVEQIADFDGDGKDDLRIRTAAGDLGAQLVKGADTLDWKYYGSVGAEWSTSLAAI